MTTIIRTILIVLLFLLVGTRLTWADALDPFIIESTSEEPILSVGEFNIFDFIVNRSGIVAEATVTLNIAHDRVEDLDILLTSPDSVPIVLRRSSPTGSGLPILNRFVYDNPDQPVSGSLKPLSGTRIDGRWRMDIRDSSAENSGTLRRWSLEIAPAVLGTLRLVSATQALVLDVDGYGGFGDQSNISASNLGGKYRSPIEPQTVNPKSTLFHSALFFHSEGRFLSSMDMYPGNRLPTVPLNIQENGTITSQFQIGDIDATLNQRLEESTDGVIRLIQDYTFQARSTVRQPFVITRYINPKFQPADGPTVTDSQSNYVAINQPGGQVEGLFVFDEIRQATSDRSRFIAIEHHGSQVSYFNHANTHWFLDDASQNFAQQLLHENLEFYNNTGSQDIILDNNGDFITDPGRGFDVALALAAQIRFDESNRATFTSITKWGYSSPAEVLQNKDSEPTVPTPSQPQTGLRAIKKLPDLRLLLNQVAENVLDLDDYVEDSATSDSELEWSILSSRGLPLSIDDQHRLSVADFPFVGDYGDVLLEVSNGEDSLILKTRVKFSNILTRNFHPVEPIILPKGETRYTSPYTLSSLIGENQIDEESGQRLVWSPPSTLPQGINHVEINDDDTFTLQVDNTLSQVPAYLPFLVTVATVTPTPDGEATATPVPVATNTPTSTPSPSASPVPTNTAAPTPTHTATMTPTPLPSNTPSPVPSPAASNTPTVAPSSTPQPTVTMTNTPLPNATRTPTPSPTLPFECPQELVLRQRLQVQTDLAPVDWAVYRSKTSDQITVFAAHLDAGTVGSYVMQGQSAVNIHNFETGFGVSNIAVHDLNQDGNADLIAYNPIEAEVKVFYNLETPQPEADLTYSLNNEILPDPLTTISTSSFRALAVGPNGDSGVDIVIRAQRALIVLTLNNGQLIERDRQNLEGPSFFLLGKDLDLDGDIDLVTATRLTQQERIEVYRNEDGNYTSASSMVTDDIVRGDFPREVIAFNSSASARPQLAALLFTGEIRFYRSDENLNFTRSRRFTPFPPGLVETIAVGELSGDSNPEIMALHRGQSGLNIFAICGSSLSGPVSLTSLRLSQTAPEGQQYKFGVADINGDDRAEVLLTQSFRDRLTIFENALNGAQ